MAKPRELRRRIKSVQSTRKITKTMELVATSKLKRAQDRVIAARPYAAALAEVIGDLYAPELAERFPLLRQPGGKSRRVALVVITAHHPPGTPHCLSPGGRGRQRAAEGGQLHSQAVGRGDTRATVAAVRAQSDLPGARGNDGRIPRRAAHGDEERDRQRG